jgi:hypothetical protein
MALYPLSYAGNILPAAGIEPATSRLTVEVTHVFTTGKDGFHFCKRRNMLRLYVKFPDGNKQSTLETKFQTGNNRSGCSGPSF